MYYLILFVGLCSVGQGIYVAKDKCPPNEEYLLCGSPCPYNCSNPDGPVDCNEGCEEGCFCLTGFLRNDNGTCVSMDQCTDTNQLCGENEEFVSCGTACPATCSVPEPEVCGVACGMGCFCKDGFYRDEINHKCVTLDKCPAQECFNENEVYDICNGSCQPSCADPVPICTGLCKSGCVCAAGWLRDAAGSCVDIQQCPNNGTDTSVLRKYINAINDMLHFSTV